MREILFRGKEKLSDDSFLIAKWVEGWLQKIRYESAKETLFPAEGIYIFTAEWRLVRIDPSTVGQFTGLTDKTGKRIFEGDIVDCCHWYFDGAEREDWFRAVIGFSDGSFRLDRIHNKYFEEYTGYEAGEGSCWIGEINWMGEDYEVIGNVFDTPELAVKYHD
jgi:uncharacterized phage protein (TIGR01671 family)